MRRAEVVTALVVYVVPLAVVSVLLTLVGLGEIALALVAVEACVAGLTVAARRRPERTGRAAPTSRPWLVPLAMVLVLGGIVGVAVLAS